MSRKLVLSGLFFALMVSFCAAKGTKTLWVADRKVACAGTFECIQIKEKAKAQWRNYPDTIEGFNYEEGYEYKISVRPVQTANSLTGVYDEKYKLLKVVSKRKTGFNPTEKLAGKKWILKSMNDTNRTLGIPDTTIFIAFNLKSGKANGKAPCNTFTLTFTCQGSKIAFTGLAATKMLCKGEPVEKIIFGFFKSIATYKVDGNTLTMFEPDGSYLEFEGR